MNKILSVDILSSKRSDHQTLSIVIERPSDLWPHHRYDRQLSLKEHLDYPEWRSIDETIQSYLKLAPLKGLLDRAFKAPMVFFNDPSWEILLETKLPATHATALFDQIPSWVHTHLLDHDPLSTLVGYTDLKEELKLKVQDYVEEVHTIKQTLLQTDQLLHQHRSDRIKARFKQSTHLGIPFQSLNPATLITKNAPAILLYGPFGVGKSDMAKALVKLIQLAFKQQHNPPIGIIFQRNETRIIPKFATEHDIQKMLADYDFNQRAKHYLKYGTILGVGAFLLALNAYILSRITEDIDLQIPNQNGCEQHPTELPPGCTATPDIPECQLENLSVRVPLEPTPFYSLTWTLTQYFSHLSTVVFNITLILLSFAMAQLDKYTNKNKPFVYVRPQATPTTITGNLQESELTGRILSHQGRTPQTQLSSSLYAQTCLRWLVIENLDRIDNETQENLGSAMTNHTINLANDRQYVMPWHSFIIAQTNFIRDVSPVLAGSDRTDPIRMDKTVPLHLDNDQPFHCDATLKHLLMKLKYVIESSGESSSKHLLLPLDNLSLISFILLLIRNQGRAIKITRSVFQMIKSASKFAELSGDPLIHLPHLLRAFHQHYSDSERLNVELLKTYPGFLRVVDKLAIDQRLLPIRKPDLSHFYDNHIKRFNAHNTPQIAQKITSTLLMAHQNALAEHAAFINYDNLHTSWIHYIGHHHA